MPETLKSRETEKEVKVVRILLPLSITSFDFTYRFYVFRLTVVNVLGLHIVLIFLTPSNLRFLQNSNH